MTSSSFTCEVKETVRRKNKQPSWAPWLILYYYELLNDYFLLLPMKHLRPITDNNGNNNNVITVEAHIFICSMCYTFYARSGLNLVARFHLSSWQLNWWLTPLHQQQHTEWAMKMNEIEWSVGNSEICGHAIYLYTTCTFASFLPLAPRSFFTPGFLLPFHLDEWNGWE